MGPASQSLYEVKLRKWQSQEYDFQYPKILRESKETEVLRPEFALCCPPKEHRAKTSSQSNVCYQLPTDNSLQLGKSSNP